MKRLMAMVTVAALLAVAIAPTAEAARVRVRHGNDSGTDPVQINIPDLPPIDYKGLTNADALTVAISKTSLLPAAQVGAKPIANLLKGTHLKKLGEEGGYFKVETADKRQGYVIKYAVARGKIALKPDTGAALGSVTAKAATDVYMFPNKKTAPKVGALKAGQKVPHLFTMGGYFKVKLPTGKIGYIEESAGTASK